MFVLKLILFCSTFILLIVSIILFSSAILQILEGRLSPRPVKMAAKLPDTSGTPFISTLGSQNQSGVWV